MDAEIWTAGLASLSAALSAATAVALVISRLHRRQEREQNLVIRTSGLGPIHTLTFSESLDPQKFAEASRQSVMMELEEALRDVAADGVTFAINGLRLAQSGSELIVSASAKGQALLRKGVVRVPRHAPSGRLLPQLVDDTTGKVSEILKEARGARRLAKLASLSSMIVGAAHMIASADIAKKLSVIDGKLDAMIQYRRIEQVAELERIYTFARELASGPIDDIRCLELMRLRGDLRQLRATWRRELSFHLHGIEDPDKAHWMERTFTFRSTNDKSIHGKITDGQIQLALMEYSMRLDQVLAIGSNSLDGFERSLADEIVEIRGLSDLLREKSAYISAKNKGDFSVDPMISALDGMIAHYGGLLPVEADLADVGGKLLIGTA